MNNIMNIDGHKAVIVFDPEISMFRGEFIGLNGGADFYAADVKGLLREGAISLRVFLEACAANGIEPTKHFSGKFQARISPELHERAAHAAAARGVSMNRLLEEALAQEVAPAQSRKPPKPSKPETPARSAAGAALSKKQKQTAKTPAARKRAAA